MKRQTTSDIFKEVKTHWSTTDIRTIYNFHQTLGGGKFGTVRLASAKSDPTVFYAIKSIPISSFHKDITTLKEELGVLQMVDHPHIIKFYESYIDSKYVHIVTEYC